MPFMLRAMLTANYFEKKILTFSRQEGLRAVTSAPVTGRAGVPTAVLLLHPLNGQSMVVMAQNHTWKQNRSAWF